jgi:hypothetical protein
VSSDSESTPNSCGLFDGFEGYRTATLDDYRGVLTTGMVVLDANVLLNLYRYTGDARDDLLTVLGRLGARLWIPHQALVEFWRNRESVLQDPRDTEKTAAEMTALRDEAVRTFRTWANRVFLPAERSTELIASLEAGFDAVAQGVDQFSDTSAVESARDTDKDAVLASLESILDGRVGPPLPGDAHEEAIVEALRRVDAGKPPGYKDKKKDDEGAAGDYLVWAQVLVEATFRGCDVLLVTGDVKEDWWRREFGELRGPRIELVDEMRARTGGRLFMTRPTRLLSLAREVLEVTVREESVADADRVDRLLAEPEPTLPGGGWDAGSILTLLRRLDDEAPVQAEAIKLAAQQAGFVSRDQVYELGDYPKDRSLRGFTRPVNRIAQLFREEGLIPQAAVDLLWAVYNEDSPSINMAAGFRLHEAAFPLFATVDGSE